MRNAELGEEEAGEEIHSVRCGWELTFLRGIRRPVRVP